jgi:hypothetical protein
LEGLRKHGYGNWLAVSELVNKPIRECEIHFRKFYIKEAKPESLLSHRTESNKIESGTDYMDVEDVDESDETFPIQPTESPD